MSSPARLLLVSGPPGGDPAALADAVGTALRDAGVAAVSVQDQDIAGTYDWLWSTLGAGIGEVLAGLGFGRLDAQEVGVLPALVDLAGVLAAHQAAESGEAVVVWHADVGPSALRAVASLDTALLFLDRVLTPDTASRSRIGSDAAVASVALLVDRIQAAADLLATAAVGWVVTAPGRDEDPQSRRTAAVLGMWGVRVEVVSVEDLLDGGGLLAAVRPGDWPERQWLQGSGRDGFRLNLRLDHMERQWLRVGWTASTLVLAQDGWRRRLCLPPALQRCRVQGASFEDGILTVRFIPDAGRWPSWAGTQERTDAER